jgi:hypothetical protein
MDPPKPLGDVFCFIIGSANVFPVNINAVSSPTVAHLKPAIQANAPQTLNGVDPHRLTLDRVVIDVSLNQEALINELNRLSVSLQECTRLNDIGDYR